MSTPELEARIARVLEAQKSTAMTLRGSSSAERIAKLGRVRKSLDRDFVSPRCLIAILSLRPIRVERRYWFLVSSEFLFSVDPHDVVVHGESHQESEWN